MLAPTVVAHGLVALASLSAACSSPQRLLRWAFTMMSAAFAAAAVLDASIILTVGHWQ